MFKPCVLLAEQVLDGGGVHGYFMHYAFILIFVGCAAIAFLYLWYNGGLDMDEEPKMQMLRVGDDNVDTNEG